MARLTRAVLASASVAALIAAQVAEATCASIDQGRCISRRAPDGSIVQFPRLNWTPIASANRNPSGQGFQISYLRGGMTRVTRNASASALGIPGSQVSGLFYQPAGTAPIVFARFAPGSNQLRIDILRIERGVDGRITVADAVFGPHHGERFISEQGYLSASDQRAQRRGLNPLAGWKSADDNVFHDICLQCPDGHGGIDAHTSGVAVALGTAMRQVGAQLGILAVAHEWIDVQEDSDGGLLWSTVTIKVSGYARPDWWIAGPIGAQLGGTSSLGICARPNEAPCRPEHIVTAGIQLAPWAGPGLPTDQDRLYYSENSQSGFTVLGYSLITAALVGLGSYAWGGEMLAGGGGADLATATATTPAVSGVSAGTAGLAGLTGAAGYVGLSDAIHPGSPTDLQGSFLGTTLSAGSVAAQTPTSSVAAALSQAATTLQIQKKISDGLTGNRRFYQGDCSDKSPRSDCAGAAVGIVPRVTINSGHP